MSSLSLSKKVVGVELPLQVRDDGATGVLAFRGDGSRHGFMAAVLALQPEGLVQVGAFRKLPTS